MTEGTTGHRSDLILTDEAVAFLSDLHRRFEPTRRQLLDDRQRRQAQLDDGEKPSFLAGTEEIRRGDWRVAAAPADLADRRVEITGPTDRKMVINALNSGARVFMADFEDANSPTWANMVEGQVNLIDAVRGRITHQEGVRSYRLSPEVATLFVRPRGWHLDEPHFLVDGRPISGGLFDFGLYLFHNGRELLDRGTGPYFYLAKLENHLEARLWNEVFLFSEDRLGMPPGAIRATVLIETILAAFEMEEILFELRQHSAGLNAGRWDYIFSIIKKFRNHPEYLLPDRSQVVMTVPFMRAYTDLLVKTCHRRAAHAIGGMAAFVPSRRNPEVNERALAQVQKDKEREASDGFDGTWVAHPDLVPVAREPFDQVLANRPNQLDRTSEEVAVTAADLLDFAVPGGTITEQGLRNNVSVGLLYLHSWLRGIGAAAISNLMEDTATAEISRSQIWQWIRHQARTTDSDIISRSRVQQVITEELEKIRQSSVDEDPATLDNARLLFQRVALDEQYAEFLTIPGLEFLEPAEVSAIV
ncbi:MAG: malate synthase A [Acidimicrobiia bacterium]